MAEFRQGMKLLGDELDGATVSLGGGGRGACPGNEGPCVLLPGLLAGCPGCLDCLLLLAGLPIVLGLPRGGAAVASFCEGLLVGLSRGCRPIPVPPSESMLT